MLFVKYRAVLIILGCLLLVTIVYAADTKISALVAVTSPISTDEYVVNQGGSSKKITWAQIFKAPVFAAGAAAAGTWPVYTSGTVLTTAEDGAMEVDTNALYFTTDAGNRGYIPVRHCTRQAASRTLTSVITEQALFDAVQDTLTLETGTYFFKGLLYITGLSVTSGNLAFDFIGAGTAIANNILYHAVGIDNNTPTSVGTQTGSFTITQQTVASLVTAGTGTGVAVELYGTFEITGAGTIIPSVTLVTTAAGTVAAGTHLCVERWNATGVSKVGQWD